MYENAARRRRKKAVPFLGMWIQFEWIGSRSDLIDVFSLSLSVSLLGKPQKKVPPLAIRPLRGGGGKGRNTKEK